MIDYYEKLKLIDADNKDTGIKIEVNWNEKDPKTNQCKVLKLTLPDGKQFFIEKDRFLAYMWLIGSADEQRKMIPQTIETVHSYKTVLGIKADKNIEKGEMINFPISLSIPCATLRKEVIGSVPKKTFMQKLLS